MPRFLEIIEEKCGPTHNQTSLSAAVSITSFTMMIFTIPFNVILIYVLIKDRKTKYKNMFYKLLLSIAFADLLTGLVADPLAVNMTTKEYFMQPVTDIEVISVHISMFYTDAVALLTLTILSIERIIAIVFPIKHYKGVSRSTENVLISCAWSGAIILVLPYFKLNFIKQSLVFSAVNVSVAVLSLFMTSIMYYRKLGRPSSCYRKSTTLQVSKSSHSHNMKSKSRTNLSNLHKSQKSKTVKPAAADFSSIGRETINRNRIHNLTTSTKSTVAEKRQKLQQANEQYKATRTFIAMICVFLATYLPTVASMLYMNFCKDCNCDMIHIMRDVSSIFILSSSLFRPLNFILTLTHIRSSVYQIFKKKHEQFTISGRLDTNDK
ncbi:5-hydroxytryptamine receptor 2A-like [Clytia hemisphaerica]